MFQKPNVVVGFGGYPTVGPILAAKICNIPSIIHEQNAIIGRANKLLSKISNKLALSFADTKNIEDINNIIFNGNPVRHEFEEIGNIDYVKSISQKICEIDFTKKTFLLIRIYYDIPYAWLLSEGNGWIMVDI